jgi:hypothetical protein
VRTHRYIHTYTYTHTYIHIHIHKTKTAMVPHRFGQPDPVCYQSFSENDIAGFCPDPPVCVAGTFSADGKNAGGDKACQLCPPGQFQTATGSSSSVFPNLTVTALTMTIPSFCSHLRRLQLHGLRRWQVPDGGCSIKLHQLRGRQILGCDGADKFSDLHRLHRRQVL